MSLAPPPSFTAGSLHSGFGSQGPPLIPPIPEATTDDILSTSSLSSVLTTDNDPDLRATYGEQQIRTLFIICIAIYIYCYSVLMYFIINWRLY